MNCEYANIIGTTGVEKTIRWDSQMEQGDQKGEGKERKGLQLCCDFVWHAKGENTGLDIKLYLTYYNYSKN